MLTVYTDGSADVKSGDGGWGFIAIEQVKNITHEFHINGKVKNTTNNRMELQAVIEAITMFSHFKSFTIHSDSQLTINCAQKLWKRNKNTDLWEAYDKVAFNKEIRYVKVKAHSGNHYNELVDKLASYK